MKSFKLVSLEIVENDTTVNIPLHDALIINKEDDRFTWLLEAYTDLSLYDYFKKIYDEDREIIVEAVITKLENDPAFFQTKIVTLNKFENRISVLLEGHLRRKRRDYSEILLESLLQKGLGGEELLNEFKEKLKSKPKIKANYIP
jgi:hypothetical protein